MVNQLHVAGLYAIADTQYLDDAHLMPAVGEAITGGARIVQYRDKKHVAADRARQATELASLCRQHGALFIINDDVELAKQAQAAGELPVHEDCRNLASFIANAWQGALTRLKVANNTRALTDFIHRLQLLLQA